jgi:hypothetical protein
MVLVTKGLRVCQLLDLGDAAPAFYNHGASEMQHLHVDLAHQQRKESSILSVRGKLPTSDSVFTIAGTDIRLDDGWSDHDKSGAHYNPPCGVRSTKQILETFRAREMLAH